VAHVDSLQWAVNSGQCVGKIHGLPLIPQKKAE